MRLSSIIRATKVAVLPAALLATTILIVPDVAVAKSDSEYKEARQECRQNADPTERDECVSNARNRYGRGNGADKKAGDTDDGTTSTDGTDGTGDRGED